MKIGIVSDMITFTTAYGGIARNLLTALKDQGHDVVNFALQYQGTPISLNGIAVYSASDTKSMARSFMAAKCDIVIHLRDNWAYTQYSTSGSYHLLDIVHAAGSKLVNYTPIHSLMMPKELRESYKAEGDYTLTMSRWGLSYIKSLGLDNADYLYHGVDPEFHAIEQEKRPFNLPTGTMLMNVSYSIDYRKMTPLILLTLKKYLELDPTAFAYMHTQARAWYANDVIASNLHIPPQKVIFSPMTTIQEAVNSLPATELNKLYNAASAYISMSASEGFGMPELEAACIGLPVLVTDFPVHREILSGFPNVHFIKSRMEYPTTFGFEWFADTDDAVNTLANVNFLTEHEFYRTKERIPEEYRWYNITARLETILNGVL